MTSRRGLRLFATFAISAALAAGLAARLVLGAPGAAKARFVGFGDSQLRSGQVIGGAVFEGVDPVSIHALRLRVPSCDESVFAIPMLLTSVAVEQVADADYRRPGYGSVDVYRETVHERFSHWRRLLARARLETFDTDDGFFIRFYAPRNCAIANTRYVAMAQGLLELGSIPANGVDAEASTM